MTIAFIDNINPIISQLIYVKADIVDQIVRKAILEMAGATDEMMEEFKQSYSDKKSIEGAFNNLRQQAKDLLVDAMEDLKKSVFDRLEEIAYKATVRKIEFDENGNVTDSEVHIDFK